MDHSNHGAINISMVTTQWKTRPSPAGSDVIMID